MKIRLPLTQNLFAGNDIYFRKFQGLPWSIKLSFWLGPESKSI